MADLILACPRTGRPPVAAERLRRVALRLAPPEVPPREPVLVEQGSVVAAVANPTAGGVWLHGNDPRPEPAAKIEGAACVGGLCGGPGRWWKVGPDAPEGTYALVRWDGGTVEAVSDICASRTLWYVATDDVFLASTSQRALVTVLGDFQLQPEATACFLSSGTLGPEVSWDARIRRLPPDAHVVLDRESWRVAIHAAPFELNPSAGDAEAGVARLREAIATTCGSLDLDMDRWVLTLSGGHDSRTLLAFLIQNGLRPRCVTWTTRASMRNPLSDVSIARVLARRFHVEHELAFLDGTDDDLDMVLTRFVAADECENDEPAGYLDGFALWRGLAAAGVDGIIRGDESFGVGPRQRPRRRLHVGGATPADYPEGHLLRKLGLAPQSWPERLCETAGEGLMDYRLRLSQNAFVPIKLAGLNNTKSKYVEVVNPHLSRRVIGTVRSLPPDLRNGRRAFLRIADDIAPFVPYARSSSTPSAAGVLHRPDLLALLVDGLTSPAMQRVLPGDAPLIVLSAMIAATGERIGGRERARALMKRARKALPTNLAAQLTPAWKGPETLPPAQVGFRALLASRVVSLFEEDARSSGQ